MATNREVKQYLVNLHVKLEAEGELDWRQLVSPHSPDNDLLKLVDRTNQLLRQLLVSSERARVGDDAATPYP